MLGVSLWELALVAVVALIVFGPKQLPPMLRSLGVWVNKLRKLTMDVREQTGIDRVLQREGIEGGVDGLRAMLRGDLSYLGREPIDLGTYGTAPAAQGSLGADSFCDEVPLDETREYPPEGVDARGAIPDDLLDSKVAEASPP